MLLLIVSCSQAIPLTRKTELAPSISLSQRASFTITPSITSSSSPTITPILVTPTPVNTKTPTPSSTPRMQLEINCTKKSSVLPKNAKISGLAVMHSWIYAGDPAYIWNIETDNKIKLPQNNNEQFLGFAVSTDGKWLAYEKSRKDQSIDTKQLIITGNDGTPIKVTTLLIKDFIYGWLDQNHLLINKHGELHNTLILWNPFSGERQEFYAGDYPNIYDFYPGPGWDLINTLPLAFDPTLSRLVYSAVLDEGWGIILWDVQARSQLLFLLVNESQSWPKWSPDGSQVLIKKPVNVSKSYSTYATNDELYSISRDGAVTRLTYLTDYYHNVDIGPYSWSPDMRYIAFWQNGFFALLDLISHKVTNYCISFTNLFAPIWSMDSKQVVLWTIDGNEQIILIDVKDNYVVKIAEDTAARGWMVSP